MASKDRSPNYPAFPLESALQWSQKLWEREHKNPAPIEAVAKATGSEAEKGVSGPARQKVAALRQYGLIEGAGPGRYKISELGLTLALHKPGEPEYQHALRTAALTPSLFAELYPQAKSSDDSIRIGLIRQRDFSEDGAKRAIAAFRDTVSFAKLGDESYNGTGGGEKPAGDSGPKHDRSVDFFDTFFSQGKGRTQVTPPPPEAQKMSLNWILPGGVSAQLTLTGNQPSPRAIERLMDYLKLMKDDLPEPPLAAAPAAPDEAADAS